MVKIIKSQTSSEGWAIVDGDKTTDLTKVNKYIDKRRPNVLYYHLPKNSANRQYIAADKLENGLVLEYKESTPTGARHSNVVRKNITEYMTNEELDLVKKYEAMLATVKERKYQAEHKELTPLEKINAQIARLQEQAKKLEAEQISRNANI